MNEKDGQYRLPVLLVRREERELRIGAASGEKWITKIIDDAIACVKQIFADDHNGHDYFHTFRGYKMATAIAEQEGRICLRSNWLFCCTMWMMSSCLRKRMKTNAVGFLTPHDVPQGTVSLICEMIETASFAGTDSAVPGNPLEGECVQDADRLDAIGAVGMRGRLRMAAAITGRSMIPIFLLRMEWTGKHTETVSLPPSTISMKSRFRLMD